MRYLTLNEVADVVQPSLDNLPGALLVLKLLSGTPPADFPPPVLAPSSTTRQFGWLWDSLEVEHWLVTKAATSTPRP